MTTAVSDLHQSGSAPGSGTFTCCNCDAQLSLDALDLLPDCPNCGGSRFRRASLFEPERGGRTVEYDAGAARTPPDWLAEARLRAHDGRFLALCDREELLLFELRAGWTRIGRSAGADIRLDDPSVSRRHALLVCERGQPLRVLDDRSLNGIFLNGARVEWSDVRDGDELHIGRYRIFALEA